MQKIDVRSRVLTEPFKKDEKNDFIDKEDRQKTDEKLNKVFNPSYG